MKLQFQVHNIHAHLEVASELPPGVDRGWLVDQLIEEFSCFPPLAEEEGSVLRLEVRGLRPGECPETLFLEPDWLAARVTPEILVRWQPHPARAEVVLHQLPRLDEVVLAAWARLVTALRFMGDESHPRGSFHAASLAGKQGALLILGDSGAGKTTLSRLLTHGRGDSPLDYLGDEDALVDRDSRGGLQLLALPRRLRLLHPPSDPQELPGRRFEGFGEIGWLAHRPVLRRQDAPLRGVVLLHPVPGEKVGLAPLPRDQLAYQLLRGFERFPPEAGDQATTKELFRKSNRQGFELATEIARTLPGVRLSYSQPEGFREAAERLAELGNQGFQGL